MKIAESFIMFKDLCNAYEKYMWGSKTKKFINDFSLILKDLYENYEKYMWKYDGSKLDVLVQDNTICFYLYNSNKEVIDEMILTFDNDEYDMYVYMCLRVMIMLYGNVIVKYKDNVLYNDRHKPYLRLIVNDEYILDSMIKVISMQDKIVIHEEMDVLEDIRCGLSYKTYSNKFIEKLNERVNVSKRVLKLGGIK